MRAPPGGDRGGADPRRRARGRRLPAGAAGRGRRPAPADRRPGGRRPARWCRPATRSGSARAASPSAWRCSCASATGSIRRWRRCSTTCRWPRAASSPSCGAICGVDAEDLADMLAELRALDPKPGLRFARGADRGDGARRPRAPRAPTAPGRSSSTARRCRGCSSTTSTRRRPAATRATRAFISECSASASWLVRSLEQRARTILKVAREIVERQERFFALGRRRAAAADPARGRRPARAARINHQPSCGRQVPLLRPGLLRVPLLLQLGDPGGRRRRGLLRRRGSGANPRAYRRGARGRAAVGRQNRRGA